MTVIQTKGENWSRFEFKSKWRFNKLKVINISSTQRLEKYLCPFLIPLQWESEKWESTSCRFRILRHLFLLSPPFQDAEVKVGTEIHELSY